MTLRPWILAARPKTLWASVSPVLMGTAIAAGENAFHPPAMASALAAALFIQIGTNYCNDVADFFKGADSPGRKGPVRATASGLVAPRQMMIATAIAFTLAALAATYLIARAGWPIAVVGVLSIASGILYTAGPYPLAYLGLGDLFTLIFFGPVAVAGTYYVQTLRWSWVPVLAGFAPGLISAAILTVNNLRDRHEDARAGKRTLAVRFGPIFARVEYAACVLVAATIPAALAARGDVPRGCLIASLVLLPGLRSILTVWRADDGPTLNRMLAATARLMLAQAVLFAIGYLWP